MPNPVSIDADGRERMEYIEGDVPVPPYPDWARTDEALVSVVLLVKRLHDASEMIDLSIGTWNDEIGDPRGGPVLCHNDVCLENVVFRDGRAVALLDFEFAAPGRRIFDLASCAWTWVPIDDGISAARLGWADADLPARLRLVADTYGLDAEERLQLVRLLDHVIDRHSEWVRRRVEEGDPGVITMWEEMGGAERLDRRRRWWTDNHAAFRTALT